MGEQDNLYVPVMELSSSEDKIERVTLSKPLLSEKDKTAIQRKLFPSEARERLTTYRAKLTVLIKWKVQGDDGAVKEYEEVRDCGLLPVMVRVSLHSG